MGGDAGSMGWLIAYFSIGALVRVGFHSSFSFGIDLDLVSQTPLTDIRFPKSTPVLFDLPLNIHANSEILHRALQVITIQASSTRDKLLPKASN
jgi:hypothetical protein